MTEKRKLVVLKWSIGITVGVAFLGVAWPDEFTLRSLIGYFSSVLGYMGVCMLLWMYMLGTRAASGLYFDDLPRITKIHSWLGKYGVAAIFLHPIFIAIKYSENILRYIFLPEIGPNVSAFEKNVTYGRLAFLALLIIWVTSALVRGKIAYRPWKYVHYLAYAALPLSLLHVPEIGSSFENRFIRLYWMSIVVTFLVFTALRARHLFGFGKLRARIIGAQEVTEGVVEMRMVLPKKIDIRPGQYVYVQRRLWGEEHPFSVLYYDHETGELALAFKVFGQFTRQLANDKVGGEIYIDGPYGVFTSEIASDDDEVVFIAGGIGVTPFVQHVMTRPADSTWMIYASQSHKLAAYRDELKARLSGQYVDVCSNEESPRAFGDERGFITADIIKTYIPDMTSKKYFVCGPKPMMRAVREALVTCGVAAERIHTEEFSL